MFIFPFSRQDQFRKKFIKRRCMTMLELVISMSLIIALLGILAFFYRDITTLEANAEKNEKEQFYKLYIENRLARILPRTISEYEAKKHFVFFSATAEGSSYAPKTDNLTFLFDNGSDLNPKNASEVLAHLFVDKQNRLTLMTWPSTKNKKFWENPTGITGKEILLENVERLNFKFYIPKESNRSLIEEKLGSKKEESDSILEGKGEWIDKWPKNKKYLPAMIEVIIKFKEKERPFYFSYPLSNSSQVIVYEGL